MKIAAALMQTLQDFPGEIAAEIFTSSCNFCCPHCHAAPLLKGKLSPVCEADFIDYCANSTWLTGVSICGGEPTIEPELKYFIAKLRKLGLAIKLDTNGSCPEVLEELLAKGLVDYVAMDIKGPEKLWSAIIGKARGYEPEIKASMLLAMRFPKHEFRTTAAPVVREGGKISFLSPNEIAETCRFIAKHTKSANHAYFIQKFVPRKGGLLDKRIEAFPSTDLPLLEAMLAAAKPLLPKAELRG